MQNFEFQSPETSLAVRRGHYTCNKFSQVAKGEATVVRQFWLDFRV